MSLNIRIHENIFLSFYICWTKTKTQRYHETQIDNFFIFPLVVRTETPFIYYNVRRNCLEHHHKYSRKRNNIANNVSVITLLACKMISTNIYPNRA